MSTSHLVLRLSNYEHHSFETLCTNICYVQFDPNMNVYHVFGNTERVDTDESHMYHYVYDVRDMSSLRQFLITVFDLLEDGGHIDNVELCDYTYDDDMYSFDDIDYTSYNCDYGSDIFKVIQPNVGMCNNFIRKRLNGLLDALQIRGT